MSPAAWTAAGAIAFVAASTCACDENTCMTRGSSTSYSGTVTYIASIDSLGPGGANGTLPATVAVDDFTPWLSPSEPFMSSTCKESGMEFTVHVGASCTLWFHQSDYDYSGQGTRYSPTVFAAASALADPSQSCAIPVSGGTATVAVDTMSGLNINSESLVVTLTGTVTSWPGIAQPNGHVEWTFSTP